MVRSFLISLLILICFALFETSILSNLLFLPAMPDFLMICVLYFSACNGKVFGVVTGFSSGLVLDFLTASPFGFHCLLRTLIGYLSGLFNRSINLSGVLVPVAFALIATVAKKILIILISVTFMSVSSGVPFLSMSFLFELLANGIFAPIVFKFLDIFSEKLVLEQTTIS
ncbi:MAG: rod shape-determining protein MreD [Treponema sp.]|nr:rod shape-determining protein MreD [Treponema sp.]